MVTASSVAGELYTVSSYLSWRKFCTHVVSLVHVQVRIHVSLVCSPDCASHARPWLLEGQNTLNIVSVNLLAGDGIDDRRLDTEEWEGGTAWLGGCNTSKRSDDVGSGLGLPVCLFN